jgi:hypothetical protein
MSKDPRGAVVSVRLPEDQQTYLEQLAEARGTSVSDLIRSYVANEMQPPPSGETVSTAPDSTAAQVDTGTVIYRPGPKHHCRPGVGERTITGDSLYGPPAGTIVMVPPSPQEYPPGTLWQCACGVVWVSLGAPDDGSPGICRWRHEGRIERWRRQRQARGAGE